MAQPYELRIRLTSGAVIPGAITIEDGAVLVSRMARAEAMQGRLGQPTAEQLRDRRYAGCTARPTAYPPPGLPLGGLEYLQL